MWGRGADGAILHCPDQDQQYKVVMGWWIVAIGTLFVIPALVGWTFEYWKGAHHL